MLVEFKFFFLKIVSLLIISPIAGYGLLISAEQIEKAWKSNRRKQKWLALTTFFIFVTIMFGWLE